MRVKFISTALQFNANPVSFGGMARGAVVTCLLAGVFTSNAFAAEKLTVTDADIEQGRRCLKSSGLIKHMRKFEEMKASKKDTVNTVGRMELFSKNNDPLPQSVFHLASESNLQTDFTIDGDGEVIDFPKLVHLSKKGQLCVQSSNWVGLDREALDGKMGMKISFDVLFNSQSGSHSLSELKDGAKDGKSHFKKMFPGPLSVMVPKMTHIGVIYSDDEAVANIEPKIQGQATSPLTVEKFSDMYVFALKDLEALGADALSVSGGEYWLMPVPSISKMKKFGFGEDSQSASD